MKSGYVTTVKSLFDCTDHPITLRDIAISHKHLTNAQISTALNYLTRMGFLKRYTDDIKGIKAHRNVWHYVKSSEYAEKESKNNALDLLSNSIPATITVTGGKNELQRSKANRGRKVISMSDVRN